MARDTVEEGRDVAGAAAPREHAELISESVAIVEARETREDRKEVPSGQLQVGGRPMI